MLQNAVALKVWFVCNSKAAHLYFSKNLISAGAFQRAIECIFIGFESKSRYACQNWHQIFVLVMRTRKKQHQNKVKTKICKKKREASIMGDVKCTWYELILPMQFYTMYVVYQCKVINVYCGMWNIFIFRLQTMILPNYS